MGWLTGSDDSAGENGTFDGQQAIFLQESDDGLTDVYFGGRGAPDGAGHGHAAIDSDGSLDFYRDTTANGEQVYTDSNKP